MREHPYAGLLRRGHRLVALAVLAVTPAVAAEAKRKDPGEKPGLWNEMPLPLPVRTPQDLTFKQLAEREYLIFNLLAAGKLAWDAGRYAEAAEQWETLLTLPGLDREIEKVVRPFAQEARKRASELPAVTEAPPPPPPEPPPPPPPPKKQRTTVDVTGQVAGGGRLGPGGAVIALRRADGKTPTPVPSGEYVVTQRNKQFLPHVLAVPVGATVSFRNDDTIYHNVFSPTPQGEFDLGLYRAGIARTRTFTKPGAFQLLCNIHAAMNAWVVALDTPWYAVADESGRFTVRHVPPGEWHVEVWHEAASQPTRLTTKVAPGMRPLSITVSGDRQPAAFPPDKYGRPRQPQLGY